MSEWHPSPDGSDAEAQYHREIYRQSNISLPIRGTSKYSVQRSTTGQRIKFRQVISASAPPAKTAVKAYQIQTVYGDYYLCYPWNGSTWDSTKPTNIAKPYKLRGSIGSEVLGGTTFSYTYGSGATTRNATWGGGAGSESQKVVPYYLTNDIIIGSTVDYTGAVDGSSNPIGIIDLNVDARAWMKAY